MPTDYRRARLEITTEGASFAVCEAEATRMADLALGAGNYVLEAHEVTCDDIVQSLQGETLSVTFAGRFVAWYRP